LRERLRLTDRNAFTTKYAIGEINIEDLNVWTVVLLWAIYKLNTRGRTMGDTITATSA
jgi:hypothetical protein